MERKKNKMKKLLSLTVCFLLVSVCAFADMTQNGRTPREWDQAVSSVKLQSGGTDYTDNTTVFANQVNTGNNFTGNSGYQGLMACDIFGVCRTYYLWVDATVNSGAGALRMSSFPNISTFSSFPYGDWRSSAGFVAGTKVSAQ